MKLSTLLVAGSLALNVALLAVYVSRTHPSSPAPAGNNSGTATANPAPSHAENSGPKKIAPTDATKAVPGAAPAKETWAKLNPGDLRALAARLRAAGFPPSVVRSVIYAQVNESFKGRREQLAPANQERPFWETDASGRMGYDAKYYAALRDINREQTQIVKDILGEDASATSAQASDYQRRRFGDLTQDKIDQLQRLDQDYNDLRNEVQSASRGIMLPEDREKLTILEQEKRADLAKLLSPQEMEGYLMRTSNTTNRLRTALTTMNATEPEFRAIYQAQSAFDEKYNAPGLGMSFNGPDAMKERQAAQAQASEQIKAALGEQRYAEYARGADREFQQLNRMALQASLPDTAALQAYNVRETTLKESNRIYDDAALSPEQKRASLQALGQSVRAEITATLGPDVGTRYLQVANRWLTALDRGAAVTFTDNTLSTRNLPVRPPPNAGTNPNGPNVGPTIAPARPIAVP
jgi:hypothetical protein